MINEALQIDIEGSPPSQGGLAQRREQFSVEKSTLRTRRRWFISGGYGLVVGLVGLLWFWYWGAELFNLEHVVELTKYWPVVFIPILILLLVYANSVESRKEMLVQLEKEMQCLDDAQIIEFDKLISSSPEVKDYFKKIKAMGREPVVADLEAAEEWVAKNPAQAALAARERLAAI